MSTKKNKISREVPTNPIMKYLYLNKGILAGALGIFLVFGVLTEFKFWGKANLINILRLTSLDSIAAFGVTLVIITGGIDLSVGALMACASTYCALLIANGLHPAAALLIGVLIATVFGAVNGGIVANTKIPPFIVTLGIMNIGRGIAYTCSAGTPIRISGDFGEIGNGYLFDTIPYPIIYAAVILAITYVLLNKTKFGRSIYAIGGNAEAAKFSGINSRKVIWIVYTFAGFLYGIYGVISCSKLYSGQPTLGQGSELTAIAAAVVGGTSMTGGVGRIGATFIGALIMDLLTSGLNFMNVPFYWQYVCQGAVVLGAVFIDIQVKKK